MPFEDLLSPHAVRRAKKHNAPVDLMELTYVEPDYKRPSNDDLDRLIDGRYFGSLLIELVIDTIDGRVVSVWIKERGGE